MSKFIKSMIAAIILSAGLIQLAQAEETAQSPIQVFNSYQDAINNAEKAGKILHLTDKQFSGYSLLPFGSRKKAFAEAQEKAEKSNELMAYVAVDREMLFPGDNPPPGSFMGGTYHVITLKSVSLLDLTADNLSSEIKSVSLDSEELRKHLLGYAMKPEFKDLTKIYREIIRARNYETSAGLYNLTQLIILHEGENCVGDLIKWAKFHKNPGVRLASDLGLIKFGKTSEVEEILKSESDSSVKDQVQKNLI